LIEGVLERESSTGEFFRAHNFSKTKKRLKVYWGENPEQANLSGSFLLLPQIQFLSTVMIIQKQSLGIFPSRKTNEK